MGEGLKCHFTMPSFWKCLLLLRANLLLIVYSVTVVTPIIHAKRHGAYGKGGYYPAVFPAPQFNDSALPLLNLLQCQNKAKENKKITCGPNWVG